MARNPNITKMKRQKFRRRRGPFRPGSDPSTMDKEYLASQMPLRKFWGENVKTGTSVDRSNIPDKERGYVDYRGHAKDRPAHREDDSNPKTLFFLHTIFPGARFVSAERERAIDAMRQCILAPTLPEHHFVIWRTQSACLRLFFAGDMSCWWFVLQENNILKSSITYGSKARALTVCGTQTIRWKVVRTLNLNSS